MAIGGPLPEHIPFADRLGHEKNELVLRGSSRVRYPAGSVGFHPGDVARTGILESGMARAYVTSHEGRQTSIAYGHRGELLFSAGITGELFEGSAQFLVDCMVIHLDMPHVRRLVATDIEICQAVAGDMAMWLHHCITLIAIHAFGSVAQRLAFDLLDRACNDQLRSGRLETRATQQDLADSIGSVREVVARAIGELRERRLLETSHRVIRVTDPHALERFAFAGLEPGANQRRSERSSAG
jgi:CRP/FNR family transcriptional regulator